jgi:hypothetical protein
MSGIISYWGRLELADVEVVIHETDLNVPANAGRKRDREEQLALPGHKLVLCAGSKVLEAQVRHTHMICQDCQDLGGYLAFGYR